MVRYSFKLLIPDHSPQFCRVLRLGFLLHLHRARCWCRYRRCHRGCRSHGLSLWLWQWHRCRSRRLRLGLGIALGYGLQGKSGKNIFWWRTKKEDLGMRVIFSCPFLSNCSCFPFFRARKGKMDSKWSAISKNRPRCRDRSTFLLAKNFIPPSGLELDSEHLLAFHSSSSLNVRCYRCLGNRFWTWCPGDFLRRFKMAVVVWAW